MTNHPPFFSVIVSTRNRKERLRQCLASLAGQNYPRDHWELIVVDDGGQEPLDELMFLFHDRLPLRGFRVTHAGCGGAKNAGAGQARGRYLIFTDDDCLYPPDWLSRYQVRFESARECLVAGCAVNPSKRNPYSDASQELVNYLLEKSNASPREPKIGIGNNFGVPAQEFLRLGGFNPNYFPMGGEDRDFAARWVAAGRRITYAPDIVVEHAQVLTFRTLLRQQFYYGRGAHRFYRLVAQRGRAMSARFYCSLFLWPWRVRRGVQAARMFLLFLCAQAAHLAGYLTAPLAAAHPSPAVADRSRCLQEERSGAPSHANP